MLPNPHFYDADSVRNKGLREQVIEDENTALTKVEAGEADAFLDVPSAGNTARSLATSGRADVHLQTEAGTYFYNYNCRPTRPDGGENPLADTRVRRALSMAIDRKLIADSTGPNPPIARSYIPADAMPDYQPPLDEAVTLDVQGARRLLAEAGYSDGTWLPQPPPHLRRRQGARGPRPPRHRDVEGEPEHPHL